MSGNICIIPARGGSKRILKKNVKEFLGKPIIAYSIEMALETGLFDEVMVSTDDLEIADIAKSYGAKVPFMRSKETSDDYATTMAVLEEVVEMYKENGKEFDAVCCLYATAVLANAEDIQKGYRLLKEADVVFPVTEFSFPPKRSLRVNETGCAEFIYPEHMSTRSQDLEPWFHDAGQWYWYYSAKLNKSEQNLTSRIIKLTNLMVQDIDTINDWKLAEIKFKTIKNAEVL